MQCEPYPLAWPPRDRIGGAEREAVARFVVGCDGATSFVRRSLGIGFEDLVFDEPWLVVDMLLDESAVGLPQVNVQYCDPRRPHTYVVLPRNLRRWEFKLLPGEDPAHMAKEETVWRLIAPYLLPGQARMWRWATYRFHALVAETWRRGSVFLAGDACHMTPPFLAQGMVQGIKDAANLAWKLGAGRRGGTADLLDTYQAERRPLVRDVIAITKGLGRIIGECDPEKAQARNAAMRAEMAAGRGTSMRQELLPPIGAGALCRPSDNGATAAGRPAPQPWIVSHGERARLDDITGPHLRMLALPEFGIDDAMAEQLGRLGVAVFVIEGCERASQGETGHLREEDAVFRDWMDLRGARAILVRPDHMVLAGLAGRDDLAPILAELADFFGTVPLLR